MPEICRFFGIVIRMYFNDHDPSHFHAEYAEFEALIAIDSLEVLRQPSKHDIEASRYDGQLVPPGPELAENLQGSGHGPESVEHRDDPLFVGAGRGETVMITIDGRYARDLLGVDATPVRWTVIGIRD